MSLSEIITILIAFHQSGMACFKYFYLELIRNYRNLFSYLVHYDRFIALIKLAFPALVCLLKMLEGTVTEYLILDNQLHYYKMECNHSKFGRNYCSTF